MAKRPPTTGRGEIAFIVRVRYDEQLFENHIPVATVTVRRDNIEAAEAVITQRFDLNAQLVGLTDILNTGFDQIGDGEAETRQR